MERDDDRDQRGDGDDSPQRPGMAAVKEGPPNLLEDTSMLAKGGVPKPRGDGKDGKVEEKVKEPSGFEAGSHEGVAPRDLASMTANLDDHVGGSRIGHDTAILDDFAGRDHTDPVGDGSDLPGGAGGVTGIGGADPGGGRTVEEATDARNDTGFNLRGSSGGSSAASGSSGGSGSSSGSSGGSSNEHLKLQSNAAKDAYYNKPPEEKLKGKEVPMEEGRIDPSDGSRGDDGADGQEPANNEQDVVDDVIDDAIPVDAADVEGLDEDTTAYIPESSGGSVPDSIATAQLKTFQEQHLQHTIDAKQGETITPTDDAMGGFVESNVRLEDMVEQHEGPMAAKPLIEDDVVLTGPNQPIDYGPDNVDDHGRSGPQIDYDPLLNKVPTPPPGGSGSPPPDDDEAGQYADLRHAWVDHDAAAPVAFGAGNLASANAPANTSPADTSDGDGGEPDGSTDLTVDPSTVDPAHLEVEETTLYLPDDGEDAEDDDEPDDPLDDPIE
jgi:hypothetical protein